MNKFWTIAGMAFAAQANAGIISHQTMGWDASLDIDGDGFEDFFSGILTGSGSTEPEALPDGRFMQHTYDVEGFFFGNSLNTIWSTAFIDEGTRISDGLLTWDNPFVPVFEDRTYTGTQYGTGSEDCIPSEICGYKYLWEPPVPYEGDVLEETIESELAGRGIIGFALGSIDGFRFGWMDIQFTREEITIFEGALSDRTNEEMVAGQYRPAEVSTPATLGLLATGLAMGAVARRRRLHTK
ncbi:hypothetical protein [Alteromonas sp. ASW11-130]|uniref:hypothetical protein n=1 Tax=Alteromonas sp. ASW11-130 TaxID=3015775 RepID=UPI002241FAA7|nr:hypothetical protein [Alteromonas sp. ASW11-130]MCW8090712.1 hypothetical protein [Alteromonas sp. ASW11-130]